MPRKESEIYLFGQRSSSPKPNPRKEVDYGINKLDFPKSNKLKLSFADSTEQKEGSYKLSEAKYSDPPKTHCSHKYHRCMKLSVKSPSDAQ